MGAGAQALGPFSTAFSCHQQGAVSELEQLGHELIYGTGIVAKWANLLPAMPASHVDAGSCPGCSTSNQAPC